MFYPASAKILACSDGHTDGVTEIFWCVTVFSSSIFYWQNILLRVKLHTCPPIASGSCS
ncbi:hypothetical protein SF123566_10450 [Shigella flexneri 1235-66]|nr:hypothetical protein SF123566_10450 [Shigella flexneri 1235-66]